MVFVLVFFFLVFLFFGFFGSDNFHPEKAWN